MDSEGQEFRQVHGRDGFCDGWGLSGEDLEAENDSMAEDSQNPLKAGTGRAGLG